MSRSPYGDRYPTDLTVGNVVSAALRIYRDRFKTYYGLALKSLLWLFVPVYGWAKYAAILGLISRLAFGEVAERPEPFADARRHVYARKWMFLLATILVGLIFLGAYLAISIVAGVFIGILFATGGGSSPAPFLLAIPIVIIVLIGFTWLISRLGVYTLPIAIEANPTASGAISRSWNLTKSYALRLQLIWFVTFLITFPISTAIDYLLTVFTTGLLINSQDLSSATSPDLPPQFWILSVIRIILSFALNALFLPVYQSVQAVIYYDLITKKEGFGLDLDKN